MEQIKIIIDTDLADDIDDAYAIKYALGHPDIKILGITTVYKNTHQRSLVARKLLALSNHEHIRVYPGLDFPLKEKMKTFEYESISNDRPNLLSYEPSLEKYYVKEKSAIDYILETIQEYDGDLVLVCIGPLTNIAKALQTNSDVFKKLKKLVIMSSHLGEELEWNLMCDPEAADVVFKCGIPTYVIGVDITKQVTLSNNEHQQLLLLNGKSNKYLKEMLEEWYSANKRPPVMHDSLTIAAITSDVLKFVGYDVSVNIYEKRGSIKVFENKKSHIHFAVSLNREKFIKDFFSKLKNI